jgi:hypothetical protein
MKRFISFSGGVESTTMCVLFGNKADAIFADTGFEHNEIYDRIDLVEKWCQTFHRSDFKIHRLIPQMKYRGEIYTTLPTLILAQKFYPNFSTRYCTRLAKIKPIDDFLEQFKTEGVELMIGLNAEEKDQRSGNHGNKKFVSYSYPLANSGLTRQACILILKKIHLYPTFPVYMKRGGCIGCYYKSPKEFTAMSLLNPEEFKIVEDLENLIQDKRKDFFSILKGKSMKQVREDAENLLFSPDEIYPAVNDATRCGVFCNR